MQIQTRGTLLDDSSFASTIHHLAQYRTEEGVLSVYLDLDPEVGVDRQVEALKRLVEPLHMHTTDAWLQGRLEYEIEGAVQTVSCWQKVLGRSVVMFFCGPGGLDSVIPLRFPIRPFARFARRPVLGPLISALDRQRRYCVVIVERQRARIISVMLGKLEEEIQLGGDVTGGADLRWTHDLATPGHAWEGDLHAQAMRIIEHLWAIDRSRPIHGLILAGDANALAMLMRLLPRNLTRAVIDETLELDINTIGPDIAHRIHGIEQHAREQEDATLIARLLEDTTGDLTVKGWGPTLKAINEGRVQVFIQPDEGARAGFFCAADHFVALQSKGPCPVCGRDLRPTEHVGEAAVRSVLLSDGQVHALAPGVAAALQPFGAGAILRY